MVLVSIKIHTLFYMELLELLFSVKRKSFYDSLYIVYHDFEQIMSLLSVFRDCTLWGS